MSPEFKLTGVHLEDIDFTDRSFSISFPETSAALEACLASTGICTPPVIAPAGKRFVPVAGRRRLLALKKMKIKETPALIVQGGLEKQALLSYSILDNCAGRRLNPLEVSAACKKLISAGFSETEVLEKFFPAFGLEKSQKILEQVLSLNKLTKAGKIYVLDKKILFSAVSRVFDRAGGNAALYIGFASAAGLGTNDFLRILDLMDDLSRKTGSGLAEIIAGVSGVEPRNLYGRLATALNPGLASLRKEINLAERRFSKRRILEIKIPEHYEGDSLLLTSSLKSTGDLDELAALLEKLRGEKDFGKIFDEL